MDASFSTARGPATKVAPEWRAATKSAHTALGGLGLEPAQAGFVAVGPQARFQAPAPARPYGSWIAFTSRNSASPYLPCSRPLPDCLKPPNGAAGLYAAPLISTCPVRMRLATRTACSTSFDQTPPARP